MVAPECMVVIATAKIPRGDARTHVEAILGGNFLRTVREAW
jgi:microsomal dipeptidase-like Zn-dependent dipeptidase